MAQGNDYKQSIESVKTDIASIEAAMLRLDGVIANSASNLSNAAKKLSAATPNQMNGNIEKQVAGLKELDAQTQKSVEYTNKKIAAEKAMFRELVKSSKIRKAYNAEQEKAAAASQKEIKAKAALSAATMKEIATYKQLRKERDKLMSAQRASAEMLEYDTIRADKMRAKYGALGSVISRVAGTHNIHADSLKKTNASLSKNAQELNKVEGSLKRTADARRNEAKGLNSLEGAYKRLNAQRDAAKKRLQDLIVVHGKNNKQVRQAQKEYDVLTAKVNRANGATQSFAKGGIMAMGRGIQNLLAAFGLVGGLYIFADMVKQGFALAKTLDSLNFAMQTVITSEKELHATQAFLADITERYGASIVTTTERYIKFRAAAMQSNVTMEDTQKIFGTMTKAAGALGLKTHELEGIYLALEQMLSKGKVTTEELRRQLGERLPGAFGIMADALGVTTSELDSMLRKGEILSAEVLPKFAEAVEKAYGIENLTHVQNLNAETSRLSNAWVAFVGTITESEGAVSSTLVTILGLITNTVKGLEYIISTSEEVLDKVVDKTESDAYSNTLKSMREEAEKTGESIELMGEAQANAAADRIIDLEDELQAYKNIKKEMEAAGGKEGGIWGSATNKKWKEAEEGIESTRRALALWNGVLRASEELEGKTPMTGANEEAIDKGRTYADVLADITAQQELLQNSLDVEAPEILDKIDALKEEAKAWERLKEKKDKANKPPKDHTKDDAFTLAEGRLERELEVQEEIRDNEEKSLQERLDAQREAAKIEANLLIIRRDEAVRLAKGRADLITDIEEQLIADLKDLDEKSVEQKQLIHAQDFDKRIAEFEEIKAKDKETLDARILYMKQAMLKRGATAEEIEEAIYQMEYEYMEKKLQDQIDFAKRELLAMASRGENTKEVLDQIQELEEQLYGYRADKRQRDLEDEQTTWEAKREAAMEYMETIADAAIQLGDLLASLAQRKVDDIDKQIEAMNAMYDNQLSNENLTEERRREIEDEREVREAQLQKKKEEAAKKAFRIEQMVRVAQIAVDTIQKVMAIKATAALLAANPLTAAAAPFALAQIPFVIGMGAAAAGSVLAQSVPEYKTGRKGGKEEIAILGDGGKHEPILDRHGNLKGISPNTPTLMKLDRGDSVLPSTNHLTKDYQSILNASVMTTLAAATVNNDSDKLAKIFDQKLSRLEGKIESGIEKGFGKVPRQGNRDLDSLANRLKFIHKRDAI